MTAGKLGVWDELRSTDVPILIVIDTLPSLPRLLLFSDKVEDHLTKSFPSLLQTHRDSSLGDSVKLELWDICCMMYAWTPSS